MQQLNCRHQIKQQPREVLMGIGVVGTGTDMAAVDHHQQQQQEVVADIDIETGIADGMGTGTAADGVAAANNKVDTASR